MQKSLLNQEELNELKELLPNWEIKNSKLHREWQFANFVEAFGFMTKVAMVSEVLGHHPEWRNVYSKVTIELTTHDLNGLTSFDIQLAKAIDLLN